MSLKSFIASSFVRMNKKWRDNAIASIELMHIEAITLTTGPVTSVCPQVLNTNNIELAANIYLTAIIQAILVFNRDAGGGTYNAFLQIFLDKYPQNSHLVKEMTTAIYNDSGLQSVKESVSQGLPFGCAIIKEISKWTITKLSKQDNDFPTKTEGVSCLFEILFNLAQVPIK